MKIRKNLKDVSTSDFWYDLTDGGYLDPAKILVDKEDIEKVNQAIAVLKEFYESCEEQIEDFIQ